MKRGTQQAGDKPFAEHRAAQPAGACGRPGSHTTPFTAAAARRWLGALALTGTGLLVASCGGGGGGGATPAPTPLPDTLAPALPQGRQQAGSTINFNAGVADPAGQLRYQWQFGDGGSSTAAAPVYSFAVPGSYTVQLTVTNEAGTSRSAQATVAVADLALAQGLQCGGQAASGWCWQRPLPQGNALADIAVTASGRGFAVGEAGTLLTTVDQGASWTAQRSPTGQDLLKVVAVSDQVVWMAAQNGEVLLSTDGGQQWQAGSVGAGETIQTLGARSAREAWVVTANGNRYATSDGGQQWQRTDAPPGVQGATLAAADGSVWVMPVFGFSGDGFGYGLNFARRSTGGASWLTGDMPPLPTGMSRNVVALQVQSASWALLKTVDSGFEAVTDRFISSQQLWRTTDGGASWQALQPAPNDRQGAAGSAEPRASYQAVSTTDLVSVAAGDLPYRSTDGGGSWAAVPLPAQAASRSNVQSLQMLDGTRLVLTTFTGNTYYTHDAGANWAEWAIGGPTSQPTLISVNFFDRREGLALARDGSSLRSSDGGRTWAAQSGSTVSRAAAAILSNRPHARLAAVLSDRLHARFLPGSRTGWVISLTDNTLLRTGDGGRTWLAPLPNSAPMVGLEDFHFVDSQRGWAVRDSSGDTSGGDLAAVFRSSDGGQTWQALAGSAGSSGLAAVRFAANGLHGVAVGRGGAALVTADGGTTWQARSLGTTAALRRLVWLDDGTTVVAVGEDGVVLRSADRGATWRRMATPTVQTLNDLQFTSALRGWAVGEQGTLLKTTDGGLTWALQATGTRASLLSLQFIDEHTGWLVGANGTVLVTVSGGL